MVDVSKPVAIDEELIAEAPSFSAYYRAWAKDIREMNGGGTDADHADATATFIDRLATALSSARERGFAEAIERAVVWHETEARTMRSYADQYDCTSASIMRDRADAHDHDAAVIRALTSGGDQ